MLAGGFVGALLASIGRGIYLGINQVDAGFGWLSIPIGAVVTPAMVFVDMLMLTAPSGAAKMVVLPWALAGFALGLIGGYFSRR